MFLEIEAGRKVFRIEDLAEARSIMEEWDDPSKTTITIQEDEAIRLINKVAVIHISIPKGYYNKIYVSQFDEMRECLTSDQDIEFIQKVIKLIPKSELDMYTKPNSTPIDIAREIYNKHQTSVTIVFNRVKG